MVAAAVAVAAEPDAAGQVVLRSRPGAAVTVAPGGSGVWVVGREPDQTVRVQRAPGVETLVQRLGGGPQIGVTIGDVEPGGAAKTEAGAVVREVTAGGPAEKAGVKAGDIFVEFDGERVRSAAQFSRLVREAAPGRDVRAVVLRDGKRAELTVTPREAESVIQFGPELQGRFRDLERELGDLGRRFNFRVLPEARQPLLREFAPPDLPLNPRQWVSPRGWPMGITLQNLTPQLADYFGVKDGVLVASVQDDSPAAKAGVKAGDVITALDGTSVTNQGDVTRALGRPGRTEKVTLSIVRDRKSQTIEIPVGAPGRGPRIPTGW